MASITRFDPFNELVDDLFKGFLVRPFSFEGRADAAVGQLPRRRSTSREKRRLPRHRRASRVKKEDIHVAIDGAQVTLEAEVKREKEASKDERTLHRRARLRQGRAQLHPAAGSRRVEGRSEVQ
jgi:HSP20 family protein